MIPNYLTVDDLASKFKCNKETAINKWREPISDIAKMIKE